MDPKKIKVDCQASAAIDIEDLVPFQGAFKELTMADFKKLRANIVAVGIKAAATVWKHKGKNYLLDGHQRRSALLKMRLEGWVVPPIPVNFTTCRDEREARVVVLSLASTYGHVTEDSLQDFTKLAGLQLADLDGAFSFPDIDLPGLVDSVKKVKKGSAKKVAPGTVKSKLVHTCPKCKHRFSTGGK